MQVLLGMLAAAIPAAFGVAERPVLLTAHAEGAQVYECKAGPDGALAWAFREPIATLIVDGKTVGRHFAGPNWQVGEDLIKGKLAANAPGATAADIPWLKLEAAERHGAGPLKDAAFVLRLDTHGGAFAGACDAAGRLHAEPYSADYVFLR